MSLTILPAAGGVQESHKAVTVERGGSCGLGLETHHWQVSAPSMQIVALWGLSPK
jgi:hypothetical protein